ncbi:TonB-dependent receptor [Flavobacteriaceae bacterium]|nr:TonB-dependent receptor [Flavobacteriaceae bacterium]
MHKYAILLLLFFSSITTIAQNCDNTIYGTVKDHHDGSILGGATLVINETGKIFKTDINGEFYIANLCNKNYTLMISHPFCDAKEITVKVNGNVHKNIKLEHHKQELNEITVNGKAYSKNSQETILKTKTIEQYSQSSLGDALREVSGVSSLNTGSAVVKPIINGLHSSRILILNNGVRLQDQEWGVEHAPNVDINAINQISVIKGSGALAYGGDAIGGVIVLKPKRSVLSDTLFGKTQLGGQSNGKGYFINSNLNKYYKSGWFAQVQGSYKKNGDFRAPDYYLTNSGVESSGVSARFGKRKFESGFELYYNYVDNEIGILKSAHIGNIKNLANAINRPEPLIQDDFSYDINPPKQKVKHHLLKASYYKRIEKFGKLEAQYDYQNNQRLEFDVRRGGRSVKPAVDLELQTHTISANANMDKNLARKYSFGLMGRYQNNFADPDTGVRRLIPDYDKYDFGIYTTTEWILNDNITADAGIRYDFTRIDAQKFYRTSFWQSRGYDVEFPNLVTEEYRNQVLTNPVLNYHNFSGALGVNYNINDNHNISANYIVSSRPPNSSELFSDGLHHSAARIERGDLRIDSEHSQRIAGTYSYTKSNFNSKIEAYYNKINDFIYLVPGPEGIIPLIRGPFPVWDYIQTDALMFGIDITADYQFNQKWSVKNKTSFIKGYDTKADLPLIDIPPFTTINSIKYSNTKWYNFNASIRNEWVLEQNEFPDEYNFNVSIANEEDIYVDLGPPLAYSLFHFQSDILVPINKKSSLNIRVGVDNIFNTSYRNYLNRLRFYADDLGRNFKLQLQLNY